MAREKQETLHFAEAVVSQKRARPNQTHLTKAVKKHKITRIFKKVAKSSLKQEQNSKI